MKNKEKIYSTIGLAMTLIALVVFSAVTTEAVGMWEDLSKPQMDKIVGGGAKHCGDAFCTGFPCNPYSGGTYWQKIDFGVTGRLCNGSPCSCCSSDPKSYTMCAYYYKECDSSCGTCGTIEAQYIPTACSSG